MKRIARIGGVVAGLAAGIVAALLLLRDKIAGPGRTPADAGAPRFRVAPPVAEEAAPPVDDLTTIKGIGPVYAARLASAGINSYTELSGVQPDAIAEQLQASASQIEDWISQARGLIGG